MTIFNKIVGIMAVTAQGVIGDNNNIPWNYPNERHHFRIMTEGCIVIMGRKTYDTIPQNILSTRRVIVFSRTARTSTNSIQFVKSLDECFEAIQKLQLNSQSFRQDEFETTPCAATIVREQRRMAKNSLVSSFVNLVVDDYKKIFMIGGAEIAHLFLSHNLISLFILTKINRVYSGNIYLNINYFIRWDENIIASYPNYTIVQLKNPKELL